MTIFEKSMTDHFNRGYHDSEHAWNAALAEEAENRNTLTSASTNWAEVENFLREDPSAPQPA